MAALTDVNDGLDTTFSVTLPDDPPPLRFVPAVTPLIVALPVDIVTEPPKETELPFIVTEFGQR